MDQVLSELEKDVVDMRETVRSARRKVTGGKLEDRLSGTGDKTKSVLDDVLASMDVAANCITDASKNVADDAKDFLGDVGRDVSDLRDDVKSKREMYTGDLGDQAKSGLNKFIDDLETATTNIVEKVKEGIGRLS